MNEDLNQDEKKSCQICKSKTPTNQVKNAKFFKKL